MGYKKHPKYYFCPLLSRIIEDFTCLCIQDACEEMAPVAIAPKEATSKENWEETCKKCTMHDLY